MNIPNKLTILRLILVPVFLVFAMGLPFGWGGEGFDAVRMYIAAGIYIVACLTDTLDGIIARKYNMITDFGKFWDPMADKVLVVSAMIALVGIGIFPAIAVIIIIIREFLVSALRLVIVSKDGKVLPAGMIGKVKTTFQMLAVIFALLGDFPFSLFITGVRVYDIMLWIAVILTVWSGVDYCIRNKEYLRG